MLLKALPKVQEQPHQMVTQARLNAENSPASFSCSMTPVAISWFEPMSVSGTMRVDAWPVQITNAIVSYGSSRMTTNMVLNAENSPASLSCSMTPVAISWFEPMTIEVAIRQN